VQPAATPLCVACQGQRNARREPDCRRQVLRRLHSKSREETRREEPEKGEKVETGVGAECSPDTN
jgi:hypothetical protein